MIEYMAKSMAFFLFKRKIIEKSDVDICRYGIEVIISNAVGIFNILLVSFILGTLLQGCIFLVLYATLRIYTGGYHADTHFKCNLYFIGVFVMTVIFLSVSKRRDCGTIYGIICLMSFGIVIKLSPVKNINRELTGDQIEQYKKRSIYMYLVILFVVFVIDVIGKGEYFFIPMYMKHKLLDITLYIKIVLVSIILLMIYGAWKNGYHNVGSTRKGETHEECTIKFGSGRCD